ncbi:STAM-binding protein-like [Mya arenaria]|uniref:STAM-binding protein-like n=1 Tax=Mya arenaria TaxID=6604 RepID=UPI0022E4898B|nr:STAM-binding protein-like [Mya arenaria]XP_052782818.1 STAM-binding protein-like [Mya arenaria]XP_052782822.1 STAM-binding protein-like [Mya arenaria]
MADSVKSNIALSLSYIRDPKAKVRELCTYAGQVEVEPSVPARRYLRSGLEMLRMAKVYKDEGEYESAFILYMKFITLFVEKLPRHPGYKDAPPKDVANIKQKVKAVFPVAEEIKAKLTAHFTAIEKKRQEEERREAEELAREQERLRQEEEARRREEEERSKKLREQSEELWLREQEEKFRQLQEREKEKQSDKDRADPNILLVDVPCPNRPSSGLNNERGSMPSGSLSFIPNDLRQGQRPKLEKNLSLDYTSNIPDRELKRTLTISDVPRPDVDRTTKPVDHFLSTGVSGTNKYGLKNVVIPRDIVVKFMSIAEQNTRRNIETCGILSGKMERGSFFITHVLVPKQTGTPDSCNAENEEDLFDFQDSNDLISLGWIHTHPTQTAFLSSVDLHTHYPYQQLMPEAVAIVVSPKFNETGVFMLTPDHGLPEVARCTKRGHHEHTKHPPVFEASTHAKFVDDKSIILVDLRNK